MKRKNNNKKGFTIVELVIVIAVIAILAAVLIPTFSNIIRKAHISSDTQLIRNLNTALVTDKVSNGDHNTMFDALEATKASGYDVGKINASATDNEILWDSKNDVFCYFNKDNGIEYIPETTRTVSDLKDEDYWVISKTVNGKYSTYLYGTTETSIENLTTGLDVGNETTITSISYVNETSNSKSVVIRTKGDMCVLNVNAPSDHVDHYGYAKEVNVIDVNSVNSYHEYGVVNELKVSSGKIVIENTAVVFDLSATTESTATVTKVAGANVMASEISTVAASETFEINSLAQLEAFRDATNSGNNFAGKTINLNVDITLNGPWTPISNYWRKTDFVTSDKWFAGTFNGNNHTIYGLSNVGMEVEKINTGYNVSTPAGNTEFVYGFFASINGAIVRDLKFINVNIVRHETLLADAIGAAIGYYLTPDDVISGNEGYNVSNITVSGTINGYDNTGSIIGYVGNNDGTFKIKNCTLTNGSIVQAIRKTGGIVGSNTVMTSVFDTCKNLGNVSSIGTYDNEATKSNGDKDFSSGNNTYSCGGMCVTNTSYTRNITFTNCESNAVSSASASNKVGQMSYVMNGNKVIINNGAYVYTPSPAGWTKDGDAWTSD